MSHGPEHQIEHAEHAVHASHDSFDRQVTISIAIVAAVLAAITMVGHRAHNETLQLQAEALRIQGEGLILQSEAGIQHNQATNKWGQYQANNIREHMYKAFLEQNEGVQSKPGSEKSLEAARARWNSQIEKYAKNMPEIKKEAEEHVQKGLTLEKQAEEKLDASHKTLGESHAVHARGDRFDLGELGLQLGVVLCSLAILTKKRAFWCLGLLCSGGPLVALTGVFGLFMDGGHH